MASGGASRLVRVAVRFGTMDFVVPLTIECVDCLGTCHRLPREPEGGFMPGAVIAYRCEDCLDRWDIQFGDEMGHEGADAEHRMGGAQ